MSVKHFILATAGHVDHGKSALVKMLTGIDPDRLPEEKQRGITIDLGFAHFDLPVPGAEPDLFRVGIVDVPGHEDFVKNMVAGVGSIDAALLVVAADDGWMPQTEEHLQILDYFGVQHAVVALTKADLSDDQAASIAAVRARLQGSPLASAPIIPTSVVATRGIAELKSALASVFADTPPQEDIGKPRLPVDRVFSLPGTGTIVTGTLVGGVFERGQPVIIQPGGSPMRVRRIQSHNQDVGAIGPGTRTALNLADIAVNDVHRGDVVTLPELGGPSGVIDVSLTISSRATRRVKDGVRVRVHHGSGNVPAHVALGSRKELAPGDQTVAQLRLESSAFMFAGDRFTLRDWPEQHTLAGGMVLDPDANRRTFRTRSHLQWLARLTDAIEQPRSYVAVSIERAGAASRSRLLLKSRFSSQALQNAGANLVKDGNLVLAGDFVVDKNRWNATLSHAARTIDDAHRAAPDQQGLALAELRQVLQAEQLPSELLEPLLSSLCEGDFVKAGNIVRRATHRPALPEPLEAAGRKLRQALEAKPTDPPSRKELASDAASQRALRFLLESGEVTEINSDLVMLASAVKEATARVAEFIRQHGPSTVSDLRQDLGSSRRVVVPFLEYLDRTFVTLRRGDTRILRGR